MKFRTYFILLILSHLLLSCVYTEQANSYFLSMINKKKDYLKNTILLDGFYYEKTTDGIFQPTIFYKNGLISYCEISYSEKNYNSKTSFVSDLSDRVGLIDYYSGLV